MKFKCLSCLNEKEDKFSITKTGHICLMCFEKSIHQEPENEKERAMLEINKHFLRQTGGNNRKFTRAYRAMMEKLSFLNSLPDKTESQDNFVRGFMEAVKTFENGSNP